MKNTVLLFSLVLFTLIGQQSYAVNSMILDVAKSTPELILENLNSEEIFNMNRKEIEQVIGKRLKWKDRGGLMLAKYKINRAFKKGFDVNQVDQMMGAGDFNFSIVGFLLGFFLSLLGILLAWIFFGNSGLKSSVFGALFNALLIWLAVR